jgi:hypothetical protein
MKRFGGADSDPWNQRLLGQLTAALPGGLAPEQRLEVANAVVGGQLALKVSDAQEAMLSSQLIAANTAALDLYRRAWIPDQSFEVRTKYLSLADKAARTVAVLSEALDRHRGRGQQQITVKHVTVNADQAVVADTVVSGSKASSEKANENHNPAPLLEARHATGDPLHGALETDREAVPVPRR